MAANWEVRVILVMNSLGRAVKWTYLGSVSTAMMQVVFLAVLARILSPEAFGLVAIGSLIVRFGSYFSQLGLGQAIVQRADLRPEHVSSAYLASTLLGFCFTGLAWAAAPLAADVFHAPALAEVVRFMAITFSIAGIQITPNAVCRRAMRFRAIAIIEASSYLVGYSAGIVSAFMDAGVFALVIASLVQNITAAIGFNIVASRFTKRVAPAWWAIRDLLAFGGGVSAISILEYLSENLDTIIVGRFAGSGSLGVYNRATSLAKLPMLYLSTSLSRVLMPVLSRRQNDRRAAGSAYEIVIDVVSAVGFPVAFGISAAAPEIIGVILGSGWEAGAPVLRISALSVLLAVMNHFGGVLLESAGILGYKALMRCIQIGTAIVLLVSFRNLSLPWFALAMLLAESVHFVALSAFVVRRFGIPIGRFGRMYVVRIVDGLVVYALISGVSLLSASIGSVPLVALLSIQILLGAALLYYVLALRSSGKLLDRTKSLMRIT